MLSTSKETVLLETVGTGQQSQEVQVFQSGVDLVWVGDVVAALHVET